MKKAIKYLFYITLILILIFNIGCEKEPLIDNNNPVEDTIILIKPIYCDFKVNVKLYGVEQNLNNYRNNELDTTFIINYDCEKSQELLQELNNKYTINLGYSMNCHHYYEYAHSSIIDIINNDSIRNLFCEYKVDIEQYLNGIDTILTMKYKRSGDLEEYLINNYKIVTPTCYGFTFVDNPIIEILSNDCE